MALIVTVSASLIEVVDAPIGMGYWTILAPVLLMMRFDPCRFFQLFLISQLVIALLAALISLTAVFTYIFTGGGVGWVLTFCLLISGLFSAPVAALIVKTMGAGN